jgi:glutamate racemase
MRMNIGWRTPLLIAAGIGAGLFSACTKVVEQPARSIEDVVSRSDSDVFSVPLERYQALNEALPIGVFDSGIGGLTVLNEIVTIDRFNNLTHEPGPDGEPDFAGESFIYLGDQANMPYGNYPSEDKVAFLKELVLKDLVFVLGDRYWPSRSAAQPRREKPPVKAVVVACNTATSYGLDDIHRALLRWDLPVYTVGVVAAGADGAIEAIRNAEAPGAVAVMATVGTCASGGYPREIARSSVEAGMEAPEVIQQGSLGLAGAIEGDPGFMVPPHTDSTATYRGPAVNNAEAPIEASLIAEYGFDAAGILGDPEDPATWSLNSIHNYIQYETTTLLEAHRRGGSTEPITTVVLGCTHFPFHQQSIEASFERLRGVRDDRGDAPYQGLIAEDVAFVDPARLTAVQLYEALAALGLLNDEDDAGSPTDDEFYISVPNAACPGIELRPDGISFTYDYKYGRSTGDFDKEYVKRVPMNRENLGDSTIETIRTTMPGVWDRLVSFSAQSLRCADLPAEARIQTER